MQLKTASLTKNIKHIILERGTEYPFTGKYNSATEPGTYLCRQCGLALFRGKNKFSSHCGWPSFDAEIPNTIEYKQDPDEVRIEIICSRCKAHLGHVFKGEGFTEKNIRHCVNSISLDFITNQTVSDTEEAILACGCFWGVEYFLKKLPGVLKTEVGYTGGNTAHPNYQQVCQQNTGHIEAVRVIYDPSVLTYENLLKYFFEIHDPTQKNGQGNDIGEQYQSVIFYYDDLQKEIAQSCIFLLRKQGLDVATRLLPINIFWPAEEYHQNYYQKNNQNPYCHHYKPRNWNP